VLHPGLAFRLLTYLHIDRRNCVFDVGGRANVWAWDWEWYFPIIYAGIAARIPQGIGSTLSLYRSGELKFFTLLMFCRDCSYLLFHHFVERGARRIPIQYAKRIVGRKVYGGQNSNLPLKVNTSGVIPPIFASSLIMFPATIATFIPSDKFQKFTTYFQPGSLLYNIFFVGLIVFFCYFYTAVTFKTEDVSDNLKKYGGFIPEFAQDNRLLIYIDYVLSRITLGGAVYISAICVLPTFFTQTMKVPFYFGGTSVLILVGVALDTVAQIETFLLTRKLWRILWNTLGERPCGLIHDCRFTWPPWVRQRNSSKTPLEQMQWPHLSTGDMLRSAIQAGTRLGMEAKSYMDQDLWFPIR